MKFVIKHNVFYTQAKNCIFCLQLGSIAIILRKKYNNWKYGARLELFTPCKIIRFSKGQREWSRDKRG